jgi:hypothetical protein
LGDRLSATSLLTFVRERRAEPVGVSAARRIFARVKIEIKIVGAEEIHHGVGNGCAAEPIAVEEFRIGRRIELENITG